MRRVRPASWVIPAVRSTEPSDVPVAAAVSVPVTSAVTSALAARTVATWRGLPGDIDSSGQVSLASTDAAPVPGAQLVITRVNRSFGFAVAAATSTKMPLWPGVPDPVPLAHAPRL